MQLFHSGLSIVEKPGISHGRVNADFGQGFYLSDNEQFAKRWAKSRRGMTSYINRYELVIDNLSIKRLDRDEEWFDYICNNRAGKPDSLAGYDAIIGPIANDTLYDTWGILTSGILDTEVALQCLRIGGAYTQIALKSEKALGALHFISADELSGSEVAAYKEELAKEEKAFLEELEILLKKCDDKDSPRS